jgi:hypothetical protein
MSFKKQRARIYMLSNREKFIKTGNNNFIGAFEEDYV